MRLDAQNYTNSISNNIKSHQDELISFDGVCKKFDGQLALSNINLSIYSGEFLLLTGPSGAGKSTFIKLLCSDLEQDSGKINFRTQARTSIVYQDLKLIDYLSVRDNFDLLYSSEISGSYKKFKKDVSDLLDFFSLKSFQKKAVAKLSGGEKQIIALLRALVGLPELLLLDEPTSSLDEDRGRKVFDLINLYNSKKNMTIVWATHDRNMAKVHSGRMMHLDRAKLVYVGNTCFI